MFLGAVISRSKNLNFGFILASSYAQDLLVISTTVFHNVYHFGGSQSKTFSVLNA